MKTSNFDRDAFIDAIEKSVNVQISKDAEHKDLLKVLTRLSNLDDENWFKLPLEARVWTSDMIEMIEDMGGEAELINPHEYDPTKAEFRFEDIDTGTTVKVIKGDTVFIGTVTNAEDSVIAIDVVDGDKVKSRSFNEDNIDSCTLYYGDVEEPDLVEDSEPETEDKEEPEQEEEPETGVAQTEEKPPEEPGTTEEEGVAQTEEKPAKETESKEEPKPEKKPAKKQEQKPKAKAKEKPKAKEKAKAKAPAKKKAPAPAKTASKKASGKKSNVRVLLEVIAVHGATSNQEEIEAMVRKKGVELSPATINAWRTKMRQVVNVLRELDQLKDENFKV